MDYSNNPNNPNNFRFIILLLLALSFIYSFLIPTYAADSCPVSVVSFIQSEDSSSVYQLTYIYNGSEYVKTVKNVNSSPLVYYWGGKIFIQSCPTSAFVDSSSDYFYRTSQANTGTTTVISSSFYPTSSTEIFTLSSKSTDAAVLKLSETTFLYSSYDLVDSSTGDPFFPNPPQWTILSGVMLGSPLLQVVGLIPIVLFWVVFYLSLRKALILLFKVLRTS